MIYKSVLVLLSLFCLVFIALFIFASIESLSSLNFKNQLQVDHIDSQADSTSTMVLVPKLQSNINQGNLQFKAAYYLVNADSFKKVYFHNSPEASTIRNAHFEEQDTVYVQREQNGYGYVEYTNRWGKSSLGWVDMQYLTPIAMTFPNADSSVNTNESSDDLPENKPVDTIMNSKVENAVTHTTSRYGESFILDWRNESSLEYQVPSEGTILMWVYIKEGCRYQNYQVSSGVGVGSVIFTTTGSDVWWPGSTWLIVYNQGTIILDMATTLGGNGGHQKLIVNGTSFKYNEWHQIGFSFGTDGECLFLDGNVIATNSNYTQTLACGGTKSTPCDSPTFGYFKSCFWPSKLYDFGYSGMIAGLKISAIQKDWQ